MLAASGCAGLQLRDDGRRVDDLRARARALGVEAPDPLALPAEVRTRVLADVRADGTELQRLERLNRYLRAPGGLAFQYDADATRTAAQAWDARGGDCLSYAHLFNALARALGVGVHYVRYREAEGYEERDGQFVAVTHVGTLYSDFKTTALVELSGRAPSWRVSDYELLQDDEALALHLSNHAAGLLARGDAPGAERVLRLLVDAAPGLPELHANLGVALMRQGRHAEALALLERAAERFPEFVPLYVNAAIAARNAGQQARADALAEKARSSWTDPFVPFMRGTWLFEQGRYAAAAQLLARAQALKPKSVLFAAWLARAQLMAGRAESARQSFALAETLNAAHPVVDEFLRLHPELGGPRR